MDKFKVSKRHEDVRIIVNLNFQFSLLYCVSLLYYIYKKKKKIDKVSFKIMEVKLIGERRNKQRSIIVHISKYDKINYTRIGINLIEIDIEKKSSFHITFRRTEN